MEDLSKEYCNLYIVRHGETEGNAKGITTGQSDFPLTELGVQQAKDLAKNLATIHIDEVFTSDLSRTVDTAKAVATEKQLAIKTTQLLRERTFGRFEGKKREEYQDAVKALLNKYEYITEEEKWRLKLFEDVETDEEVASRVITFLREVAVAYPNKNVLIVTSSGCIRTFLIHAGYAKKGELRSGAIKNGKVIKVKSDGVDFFVEETDAINTTAPSKAE